MPSPHQLKDYLPNSYYHIYNRGINSNPIFHDARDCEVFLHYLEIVLLPIGALKARYQELKSDEIPGQTGEVYQAKLRQIENAIGKEMKHNLSKNIDLLAYCLMPNHFHLLVYQRDARAIEKLMRQLASGYTNYYRRVYPYRGPLFESRYKAGCLHYDPSLQTLITGRYVERNPLPLKLLLYPYSSLKFYKNRVGKKPTFLKTTRIKKMFSRLKENPNGDIEERIAKYESYVDFVLSSEEFSLEELKEFYISQVS